MQETEQNNVSSDFLRVLLALKSNILKDTNVADVCKVMQKNSDGSWSCQSLNDSSMVAAQNIVDLDLAVGDFVCVLYIDQPYRSNLLKAISRQPTKSLTEERHSKSAGLIIAVVYTTRTNTILQRLSDIEERLSKLE